MARLTALRWLAWTAAAGMFLVLVMGVTVTTTGSAEGCGRDWPLCHGRFIPDFAVATAIEFSHRAITGVEGVLIVLLAVLTAAFYWNRRPIRVLVPLMVAFLLLQAGMGAWAVKYPQLPVVLALHFGISLVALASTVLVALYLGLLDKPAPAPAGRAVTAAAWGLAAYLYVLVYSGAYIRHVGAAAGCASWPLCASPVSLLHRGLAGLALLLALGHSGLVAGGHAPGTSLGRRLPGLGRLLAAPRADPCRRHGAGLHSSGQSLPEGDAGSAEPGQSPGGGGGADPGVGGQRHPHLLSAELEIEVAGRRA